MNVVDLDRRAAAVTAGLLEAAAPDSYGAPTPCPAWTVGDLVTHLVAGNVKYVEIANGQDWSRNVPEVLVGDDAASAYRQTAQELFDAWQRPGVLEREVTLPRGRGPAESALHLHLGETLVHGWDLARATRQEPAFDADVVEASLAWYGTWLPAQRPPAGAYGDAVDLSQDAAPIDRLAAYLGRDVGAWS